MANASTITRTVDSTPGVRTRSSGTGRASEPSQTRGGRPVEVRTMVHSQVVGAQGPREGGVERTAQPTAPDSALSGRVRSMLASIDKHGDLRGAIAATPSGEGDASAGDASAGGASGDEGAAPTVQSEGSGAGDGASDGPPEAAAQGADAGAATAQPEPAKPALPATETKVEPAKAAPAADPEIVARAERLAEHNRRLVAELERLQGKDSGEPDERGKALDEIERGFTTDPIGALRKLVALNAGIKDPEAPEVGRLMAGLYSEWTGHELKMELNPGDRAAIGVERNRLLIERDKREREAAAKAEQSKAEARAKAEAKAQEDSRAVKGITAHLEASKHAERFPLTAKHAQAITGAAPADLLWGEIKRGIAAGEFDPKTSDDVLINHYSKEIESKFQKLRELFAEPSTTSTATPAPANVTATENKTSAPARPENQGARTITNASASVAPAAPPTPAPAKATPAQGDQFLTRNKGESEDAFRLRAARHRFGES